MRNYEGWFLELVNNVGNRKSFAAAGDAKKHLVFDARFEIFDQLGNGGGLVAGGAKRGLEVKP